MQELTPILDPQMSESSYGFRPNRSAHQALKSGSIYVEDGYTVAMDLDMEKFFDKVNHDILMSRLARRIKDKRVLYYIRRMLKAGMMDNEGIKQKREQGTPQGGPLSPLLANVLLDDLDRELEGRGLRFCRYADDCIIFVRTMEAGERVLRSISQYIEEEQGGQSLELRLSRLHHRSGGQVENSTGKRKETKGKNTDYNSPESPRPFARSNSGTHPRNKRVDELLQAGSNQQAM